MNDGSGIIIRPKEAKSSSSPTSSPLVLSPQQSGNVNVINAALTGDVLPPFVLRTSDRLLFRRCRRLWGWMSHNRQSRVMKTLEDYFWLGTGVHYALEDYHGLNFYGHPAKAFLAYSEATRAAGKLPGTWQENERLGIALMSYYAEHWLRNRNPLETFEVDGIPQCEVNGAIDLGVKTWDGRRILYGFTMDRIVIDEYDRLWVAEYKTAKQIRLYHFDVDEQITSYCWAAWRLYQRPVAGVIYQQHRKSMPVLPKVLASGKVSTDSRQATSAAMYSKMLCDMYGTLDRAPHDNIVCYNKYVMGEDEDRDRFVVRHRIERNERQLLSFEEKIFMELEELTRPDLPLYPNPTKDCEFMCPMQAACVAMDDGSEWEGVLDAYSVARPDGLSARDKEQATWRHLLPEPEDVHLPIEGVEYSHILESSLPNSATYPEEGNTPEENFLGELGLI